MSRKGKKTKPKSKCCNKPLHKACKRCPRRFARLGKSRRSELPPCVADLLGR